MKYKCPICGSTRIYQEISVVAKKNINTDRIYGVNKNNIDNEFTIDLHCDKCEHVDLWKNFEGRKVK